MARDSSITYSSFGAHADIMDHPVSLLHRNLLQTQRAQGISGGSRVMRLVSEGSEEFAAAKTSGQDGIAPREEVAELESPSLFADVGHGPPAFEVKFLLDES